MIAVDTNIIIRFLTHDDEKQYQKAFLIFNTKTVFIPVTVVLEVEWVLRFAYGFSAEDICLALDKLFGLNNVHTSNPAYISQAIEWHKLGLDFSDTLHPAHCQEHKQLYTFDPSFSKKAKKLTGCSVDLP